MDENSINKNENLYSCIKKKGLTLHLLSEMTDIPETTLSRIINNRVKTIKPKHMEAIAKALNVPIHSLFSTISMDQPLLAAIRPENAGTILTKTLGEDESLLLYFYQNSTLEARKRIIDKAKAEAQLSQKELYNKSVEYVTHEHKESEFEQLSFNLN